MINLDYAGNNTFMYFYSNQFNPCPYCFDERHTLYRSAAVTSFCHWHLLKEIKESFQTMDNIKELLAVKGSEPWFRAKKDCDKLLLELSNRVFKE
jgi:hypothetical protein